MSQSRQIICGVPREAFREGRAKARSSRAEALALGAAAGFLAGAVWVWTPLTLIAGWRSLSSGIRRESLAATIAPRVAQGQAHSAGPSACPRVSAECRAATNAEMAPGAPRNETVPSDIQSSSPTPSSDPQRAGLTPCARGMRLIDGEYCSVVAHRCIEPFTDGSGRCKRYAPGARCFPPVSAMRFCIDEFEYPNRRGEKPAVMVTFEQAQQACRAESKRLCSAREWTLACEGPERTPYPNGLVRDATACNIDLPHRFPDAEALNDAATRDRELERLDQRAPSGSKPACASRYGVQDLVGNVDEWVVPDGPEEAAGFGATTALKGGYFGPVRARCRPSTPSHGPTFRFYQVGFRCCREAAVAERRN